MALLRNGNSLGSNNHRIYAGPNLYTIQRSRWTGPGAMRGFFVGEGTVQGGVGLARTAGRPNGYGEGAWQLPYAGGGMSAYTVFDHPHELLANLAMGINVDASMASVGEVTTANLQAFANLALTLTCDNAVSADLRATANLVASMAAAGDVSGTLQAFANLVCSMVATGGITSAEMSLVVALATNLASANDITASMTLVTGLTCALVSSCTMAADARLVTQLASTLAATGDVAGSLGALANLVVALDSPNTVTAALRGTADLAAALTTSGTTETLTSAAIASAVWQYLLSGTTAGDHLQDAAAGGGGGGGGDPTAIANAVWGTNLPGIFTNPADAGYLVSLLGRLGSLAARGRTPQTEIEMAYQQVADFQVTLPPDDVQLTWPALTPGTPPTSYVLTKSTDNGRTFAALATVDHDMTDTAVFDQTRQVFYYTDLSGISGHVYKIVAMYGATPNLPAFAIVPVFPPLCTVFGYVFSLDGNPLSMEDRRVSLKYVGAPTIAVPLTAGVQKQVAAVVGNGTQAIANIHGVWQLRGIQGALVEVTTTATGVRRVRLPSNEGPVNFQDLVAVPAARRDP